jgi:hypothetical protein
MKKSAKILITAALAAVLSLGSFAAGKMIDITVDPTVKIKVNGTEFRPKDANGNDVMTFIYNGTTYAPLRALAEAYGLEVGYDAAANMATVDEPGAKQTATAPAQSGNVTMGMENALKKADSYLSWGAFSYSGLIGQLEFEKFSHEEAVYAADNCGADWYEQAVKKAESYLSWGSFSKEGLIGQLEFEGFTNDQAVYAVTKVGY